MQPNATVRVLKAHPATVALGLISCLLVGFNFWYAGVGLKTRNRAADPRLQAVREQVHHSIHGHSTKHHEVHQPSAEYNSGTSLSPEALQPRAQSDTSGSRHSSDASSPTQQSSSSPGTGKGNSNTATKPTGSKSSTKRPQIPEQASYLPEYQFEVPDPSRKTSECDMCSEQACKAIRSSSIHSGTVAMAELLANLGLDVQTDWSKPGDHGHISWIHLFHERHDIQPNRSKYPVPHYGRSFVHYGRRYWSGLHLVRNPLKSLTSIACTEPFFQTAWWYYISAHVPMDKTLLLTLNHFGVAMAFFLAWHKFADSTCMYRLRLEDAFNAETRTAVLGDVFNLVGLDPPTATQIRAAINATGHETNARTHRPTVTWEELFSVDKKMAREVLELSRSYGYAYADVDLDTMEKVPLAPPEKRPDCQLDRYRSHWGGGWKLPSVRWD